MSAPYFPFYPADFEADTSHLTLEEDGAYNRLLRLMWLTPGCSLPDDSGWIARRMRVDMVTFLRLVEPLIGEFMARKNGRIYSPRLTAERQKLDETYRRRSEAGKKGGRPKVLVNKRKEAKAGLSPEKAGPKQPEPEPDVYSETNVSDGEAVDFAKALFERGVGFLGRHGTAEKQARALIGRWRKEHDDREVFDAFAACSKAGAVDPVPWITTALQGKGKTNGQRASKGEERMRAFISGARGTP